jgi:serine/threonine protein kinase
MKRKIEINVIKGITVNKLTDEFVIHCLDKDYDYYYISQAHRKRIVEIINKVKRSVSSKDLDIVVLETKSLKHYDTSTKEKRSNPEYSRMDISKAISITQYNLGIKKDELKMKKRDSKTMQESLYNKEVTIDNFKIINILGRGSFGDVVLVEYLQTKELFAMKILKKELLIEQELIEKSLLEKKILQSIDHPFLINMNFCFQNDECIYLVMPFMM